MRILIFKTDKLGDFLNISSIINNIQLNCPNSKIDVICSKYNYGIAKYYSNINKFFFFKSFFSFILTNFKIFFFKYDYLFQLDGKNTSYLLSIFLRSKFKCCIRYIKKKKFFNFQYTLCRPNFFLKPFFNLSLDCIEDYLISNNLDYHYVTMYQKLLTNCKFKIINSSHYFPVKSVVFFSNFKVDKPFILFHFDVKNKNLINDKILNELNHKINKLSKNCVCILTSDKNNYLLDKLIIFNKNVIIYKNLNLDQLIFLIYKSSFAISFHSGLVIHLSACFNKKIIDIIPKNKFRELDRWIPLNSKYKRFEFEKINNINCN